MKRKIKIIWSYFRYSVSVFRQLNKGQKIRFELLQLSHRIEKGLTISNPKPLWGWDKARRIALLIQKNDDEFSNRTASAVLSAFLDSKSHSDNPEEIKLVDNFSKDTGFIPTDYKGLGGVKMVHSEFFSEEEISVIERLFETRHSVREFSEKPVPMDVIYKAVEMAQRSPSACNRQPYKCYVIGAEERSRELPSYANYNADKYLIITGDIRAFVDTEINDWIVSPVIFASYLTLSLHALGVGSCVLKKQLVSETEYSSNFRKLTALDDSEFIVLEIAIGYYKEHYMAPVSLRDCAKEAVKFAL